MTAPDYISPIVGYRVWCSDAAGLKSLNGIPWRPGKALIAECSTQGNHETPQSNCTCGVYASKSLDHLRRLGLTENRICGEVWLWGTVVEHEEGWRAEFAYPKRLMVPLSMVSFNISKVEPWLASLSAYSCDISIDAETGSVPLWRTDCGIDATGIELLLRRCKEWYVQRAEQRKIKRGDRMAVKGHGIAIVEDIDSDCVQAVLGNRSVLRIGCNEVVWCDQYTRWETAAGVSIGLTAFRTQGNERLLEHKQNAN